MRQSLAAPLALSFALTLVLLTLPAGCGPNGDDGTPGDIRSTLIGRACNVDQECGSLRCDEVRRQCVCLSDTDCLNTVDKDGASTLFCNNFTGLCTGSINGCTDDSACDSSSFCDQQTRSCKVRKGFCEACVSDRECGGVADDCVMDTGLNQAFCGTTCSNDGDCATGATCQDLSGKKQCWPKAGRNCRTFTGCIPDARKPCTANADCSDIPDQICEAGSGLCVARIQLCPFGQVCDGRSRVCVDACSQDSDCTSIDPRLRCVSRVCEPLGECAASAQDPTGDKSCPTNKVCTFAAGQTTGTCAPFCASNNDCPQGSTCRRTPDNRSKCQAGCVANADCLLDQRCVKPAGSAVGLCEGTSQETCQTDAMCPTCSVCEVSSNTCRTAKSGGNGLNNLCKPCGSNTECGQGGQCLQLNDGFRCGQPCPPAGCPRGFFCAEVCLGGYQGALCNGTLVAQCIPSDQSCAAQGGASKCGF